MMAEKSLIVDNLNFSYEGLFNVSEVYKIFKSVLKEREWGFYEKLNEEMSTPTGKHIKITIEPSKTASDFYKLAMKIRLYFVDVIPVEVEKGGEIIKINKGKIIVNVDGYVIIDKDGIWSKPAKYWFFNIFMHKYFYKDYLKQFEDMLKNDLDDLVYELKSYLNVYQHTYL